MADATKREAGKPEEPEEEAISLEPRRGTVEDLAAFIAKRKPPEEVAVDIVYVDGDERTVVELHFKRSHAAFTRYAQGAYGPDGDAVGASAQFLIDCSVEAERPLVMAFVDAYPVNAVDLAAELLMLYGYAGIEAKIKNT
jgi:hypothetical protein